MESLKDTLQYEWSVVFSPDEHNVVWDGKKISVSEDNYSTPLASASFLKLYADALNATSTPPTVGELPSPVLRMFMQMRVPDETDAVSIAACVQSSLKKFVCFVEPVNLSCGISVTPVRHLEGAADHHVRLSFYYLLVSQASALIMRETILLDLASASISADVERDCYVDSVPLLGAKRLSGCAYNCGKNCGECGPYAFKCIVNSKGEVDESLTDRLTFDTHLAVMFTSIHTPPGVSITPYIRPRYAPSFLQVDDKSRNWVKRHTRITDKERLDVLEWIIKNVVDRQAFGRIMIEHVFLCGNPCMHMSPKKHKYIVTVKGEGSSYCLNMKRDHFSNRIYFEVTPEGVAQRCFGQRTRVTGSMVGSSCPRYRSYLHRISGEHQRRLFPRFVPKR